MLATAAVRIFVIKKLHIFKFWLNSYKVQQNNLAISSELLHNSQAVLKETMHIF